MPRSLLPIIPGIDRNALHAYQTLSLAACAGKSFIYIIATGVNGDDRREILRMEIAPQKPNPSGRPSCAS